MKVSLRLLWMILGILVLDIVSKAVVHSYFRPFEQSPHFQFWGIDFCIHHVTNQGVAWGVGGGWQKYILLARIGIVGGLSFYLFLSSKAYLRRYAYALIVAGGLGNILDYFVYGHVVDMFHFIFWGYSYPVFNIADSSIFLGIVSLLWRRGKSLDAAAD